MATNNTNLIPYSHWARSSASIDGSPLLGVVLAPRPAEVVGHPSDDLGLVPATPVAVSHPVDGPTEPGHQDVEDDQAEQQRDGYRRDDERPTGERLGQEHSEGEPEPQHRDPVDMYDLHWVSFLEWWLLEAGGFDLGRVDEVCAVVRVRQC